VFKPRIAILKVFKTSCNINGSIAVIRNILVLFCKNTNLGFLSVALAQLVVKQVPTPMSGEMNYSISTHESIPTASSLGLEVIQYSGIPI
jgi:hypothetical protein